MRLLAVIGLLCLLAGDASATVFPRGSGACPNPNTIDGATILPNTSCTLVDNDGTIWGYQNTTFLSALNVAVNIGFATKAQLARSGGLFYAFAAPNSTDLWFARNHESSYISVQTPTPSHAPLGNIFLNVTTATGYPTISELLHHISNGQTIEIPAVQAGIYAWDSAYQIAASNLTVNFDSGAVTCCATAEGAANWTIDTGSVAVDGDIFDGGGNAQISYTNDSSAGQFRGIYFANSTNWTLQNGYLIHDNDFGLQANNGPSANTIHVTNVDFVHNGSGKNGSTTHNVYFTLSNTTQISKTIVSGHGSYCTNQSGFEYKNRWAQWDYHSVTAADVDPILGNTDCNASGAFDLPCGGAGNIGAVGAGNGVVAELGTNPSNAAVIRFAAEAAGPNCPNLGPGGVGWTVNTLAITNSILINDWANASAVMLYNALAQPVTVSNTKIVCNSSIVNCDFAHMFPSSTDAGGNTFFATRAAAGLAAYPALPAVP